MSADLTIKQLLAERGITVRKVSDDRTRQLWQGNTLLGHFDARDAVARFLPEYAA